AGGVLTARQAPPARHRPGARVRSAGTDVSLISSEAQWVRSRVVERVFFLEREDNMSALRKFIDAVNTGAVQLGKAVAVPAAKRPPPPETHAPPAPAAA